MDASGTATGQVRSAGRSSAARRLVLVGWAAKGVVYVTLAWLVLQLAFGQPPADASSQGALSWIASTGPGTVALLVLGVGLLAFALGRVLEVTVLADGEVEARDRVEAAVLTVVYLALAISALGIAVRGGGSGGGGGGGQAEQQGTALVLGWPGGRYLVGAVALGVVAFGAYSVYEGVREQFLGTLRTGEMSAGLRRATRRVGTAAYVTRGVVFALVGWFLLQAAVTFDPQEARGLDGALREVADAPWGPVLLAAIAAGLLCYGAFCLLESRYRRVGSSATGTT